MGPLMLFTRVVKSTGGNPVSDALAQHQVFLKVAGTMYSRSRSRFFPAFSVSLSFTLSSILKAITADEVALIYRAAHFWRGIPSIMS